MPADVRRGTCAPRVPLGLSLRLAFCDQCKRPLGRMELMLQPRSMN
jgi:hypothetical protein